MMELLSPAGDMECLIAAVQNGADAVYFGGGSFNARRLANNFSGDELVRAVDYCHERDVRCYITLNTLIFNRELSPALDFAAELYRLGVDAVLVQDLGLASVLRRMLPGLTLHASTQMGIHDLGGLSYCRGIGVRRAVLAREVGIDEIEFLAANGGMELETFAHGALCMSFSGSCLYSSMAGERSGNRGTCAQPCRKRAGVSGRPAEGELCLSPNDICMISEIEALKRAGVACVKIEGRMKKPEYVATVTRCYRSALDGASEGELAKCRRDLFELFNRGDFNTAHLYGDSVRTNRTASSKPSRELVRLAENSMKTENRKRHIALALSLRVGEKARLSAWLCGGGERVSCAGARVQQAQMPQTERNYIDKLAKLGDTPFTLEQCSVDMASDCYLSAADLNDLRRRTVEKLLCSLHIRNAEPEYSYSLIAEAKGEPEAKREEPFIYARVRTAEEASMAFGGGAELVGVSPVFFNESELDSLKKLNAERENCRLLLILPNVLITREAQAMAKTYLSSGVFCGAEANNIGQAALLSYLAGGEGGASLERNCKPLRIAGIGLNALNIETVRELRRIGFDYIVPSAELTAPQLAELAEACADDLIISVHGRAPLMQLLHCPVAEHAGCKRCTGAAGSITDEAGRVFPLINYRFPHGCLVCMLNCHMTDLIDYYERIPACSGYCLSFFGEKAKLIGERLAAMRAAMRGEAVAKLPESTRGHWNRRVD